MGVGQTLISTDNSRPLMGSAPPSGSGGRTSMQSTGRRHIVVDLNQQAIVLEGSLSDCVGWTEQAGPFATYAIFAPHEIVTYLQQKIAHRERVAPSGESKK